MKKPEKYVDIDFVKETTFHKLVNSNREMIKYLQTLLQFSQTLKDMHYKHSLVQVKLINIITSDIDIQSPCLISNLQGVIKSKEQIINLLRRNMKTLQDRLNVNECNTWKYVGSISNKIINTKHKLKTQIVALRLIKKLLF